MGQTDSSGLDQHSQQIHDSIERLAYSYWEERGCPFAEVPRSIGFRAEEATRALESHERQEDPLVAAAKAVGSAAGVDCGCDRFGGPSDRVNHLAR